MTFDVKGIVAVLVVLASFGLVGIYVVKGQVPDATVVGLCGTSLGLVLGFYFGHVNGVAQQAATQAAQLSIQAGQILQLAQKRRSSDPLAPIPDPPAPPADVPPKAGNP